MRIWHLKNTQNGNMVMATLYWSREGAYKVPSQMFLQLQSRWYDLLPKQQSCISTRTHTPHSLLHTHTDHTHTHSHMHTDHTHTHTHTHIHTDHIHKHMLTTYTPALTCPWCLVSGFILILGTHPRFTKTWPLAYKGFCVVVACANVWIECSISGCVTGRRSKGKGVLTLFPHSKREWWCELLVHSCRPNSPFCYSTFSATSRALASGRSGHEDALFDIPFLRGAQLYCGQLIRIAMGHGAIEKALLVWEVDGCLPSLLLHLFDEF